MKFLCDRCKTRYSIGDDRVRGKILKIRCKNCANVITVREGMEAAAEAGGDEPSSRRNRPTTAAPLAQQTLPAARNGKPASAAKPPPALEEEWYVSVDGDQSGPFTLAEAQRWVAGKAWDADLHCWSEGFDDWLPVDKVSHFRGLRKKPLPAQKPPPLPRAGSRMGVAAQPQVEEEPKALFAATMAQLEKGIASEPISTMPAPSAIKAAPSGTGAVARQPQPSVTPVAARTNGSAALKAINVPGSVPKLDTKPIEKANDSKPVPKVAAKPEPAILKSAPAPVSAKSPTPARGATKPGLSPGGQALAAAFDASDSSETALEGLTQVESPAFNDEVSTTAEPVATKRAFDRFESIEAKSAAQRAPAGWAPPQPPVRTPSQEIAAVKEAEPDEDNLEIGEVSRVVNLADLMKSAPRNKTGRAPALRTTGSVQRMTPAELGLSPLAASGPLSTAGLAADAGVETALPPPPVVAHRRAMLMLVIVAAIVLGAATAIVVVMMQGGDDDDQVKYGRGTYVDTDRPDDPRRNPLDPTVGPGSAATPKPHPTFHPFTPNTPHPTTGSDDVADPHGSLRGDEIEDVARLHQATTNRCYMRAQRGVDALTIGEVKRITVSLTDDREGAVTAVNLSDHGSDSLGKCLIGAIRGWKLRASPGGNFQITLAFTDT